MAWIEHERYLCTDLRVGSWQCAENGFLRSARTSDQGNFWQGQVALLQTKTAQHCNRLKADRPYYEVYYMNISILKTIPSGFSGLILGGAHSQWITSPSIGRCFSRRCYSCATGTAQTLLRLL